MGEHQRGPETGTAAPHAGGQPRNFLRPCTLLLLDEEPAYGYELRERLRPFAAGTWDAGTIYRLLNTMEDEGLVASLWERSESGPRRRRYHLTEPGRTLLAECARELAGVHHVLAAFLARYDRDLEAHGHPAAHPDRSPWNGTAQLAGQRATRTGEAVARRSMPPVQPRASGNGSGGRGPIAPGAGSNAPV